MVVSRCLEGYNNKLVTSTIKGTKTSYFKKGNFCVFGKNWAVKHILQVINIQYLQYNRWAMNFDVLERLC